MKLTRRSFISSIAAAGLLAVMPKPVRAWANGLYLPAGAKLYHPDGLHLATMASDIWIGHAAEGDSFIWADGMSRAYQKITIQEHWALVNTRARLSLPITDNDKNIAEACVDLGLKNPLTA